MKYLLDTNICVFLIKRKDPVLNQRIISRGIDNVAISTLTVAELQFGVEKSLHRDRNEEALLRFLSPFMLLEFDSRAAVIYGRVRWHLERSGMPIGALDTLLASQALAAGMTMVTNNTREFARVKGLVVEDWS